MDGFRGDYGGHVMFSKDKEALAFLVDILQGNVHEVRRENRVLYKNAFVKYPFENDLASIPVEDRYECLYHFLYNDYNCPETSSLKEWIYITFGKGIAERYLMPYNQKIWKANPSELSVSWVERIPKPPKEDVIKSALGISTEGYIHQLFFKYPAKGGIEALILAMANKTKVKTGFKVTGIRNENDGWTVQSEIGETYKYDHIISTIPVFDLFNALEQVDPVILSLINQLRYNTLIVVMVCLSVPRRHNFSAMYVPDPDIVFHRVCYMDYFSRDNSPEGCSAVIAEITVQRGEEVSRLSDKLLADIVINDLAKMGLIDRKKIVDFCVRRQKYGYVVNYLGYESLLKEIHTYLDRIGLSFCGRFAEFRYLNMDGCVRSAFGVAQRIRETLFS
jgi:protoporphyrinogen oxidase